jgi:hypothetical protein
MRYGIVLAGLLAASPGLAAFFQGGVGVGQGGGGGPVTAVSQNGQTFVAWPDQATGATGDKWRYEVYESASTLNSGNCTAGTKVGTLLPNNSAQLLGGNPDTGGQTYTQAHRQDATVETVALSLLGTPYPANTGVFARTIPSNRTINYCVMAVDNPANSGGNSPTFIGAVGPLSETAAAIQPIMLRQSTSRSATGSGSYTILGTPANMGVEINLHASQSGGGTCSNDSTLGDFWVMFGDPTMGPQDGIPSVYCALQIHSRSPNVLNVFYRETRWSTTYEGSMSIEPDHVAMGSIPSAQTQTAYSANSSGHMYPFDLKRLQRFWNWMPTQYTNLAANAWVLYGQSLGGWGTAQIALREDPTRFALCVAAMPRFMFYDDQTSGGWPTINTAPFAYSMGTNAAAITLPNNSTAWGGAGGWTDLPSAITNATGDLCPLLFSIGAADSFSKFANVKTAAAAFESAHQFHAFAWNGGTHSNGPTPMYALWKQWGGASGAPANHAWDYDSAWFKNNVSLPVFSNASFDDDPAVDTIGCQNCGWQWSNTADAAGHIAFSIQNNWMNLSPSTAQSGFEPIGPRHGPFTTATADITIGRRAQTWSLTPSVGTAHCTNTPNGGSPSTQALTADSHGLVTFVGAVVNSSGAGTMDCVTP